MANVLVPILEYAQSHHGVVDSAALTHLGVSPASRARLCRTGLLIVIHEGVYRLRGWTATFESRCAALCAADASIVICCRSAGRLHNVRTCHDDTIHALTTRTTVPVKVADHDVVIHRTTTLPAAHVIRRADGIRLTSAARTVFDEARHRDPLMLESMMEDAIDHGKCTVQTLRRVSARLSRRGRPGSAVFNQVLASRPTRRRAAGSHPELVLRDALRRAGLDLATQPPLALPDGRTIHPDLGDAAIAFYVEVDDHEWHGPRRRRTRDYQRDRQAVTGGACIVRVGTDEIETSLDDVVRELVRLHAARAAAFGGPHVA